MISKSDKILLLNTLIAGALRPDGEIFAGATAGIERAIKDGGQAPLAEFARRIAAVYSPDAALEFLDFSGGYFDPLFALPVISAAARRMAGCKKAVLVINGLSDVPQGRRRTQKVRLQKAEDLEFVEGAVSRYKTQFPNLEIFFI